MQANDRFIRMNEVEAISGFRRTYIYNQIKKGRFPHPVKFGQSSRWSMRSVQSWMAEKMEGSNP